MFKQQLYKRVCVALLHASFHR